MLFYSSLGLSQCSIVCYSTVHVALDGTGNATLTLDMLLATPPLPGATYTIVAPPINCSRLGDTISYILKVNCADGSWNQCWGQIIVHDYIPPSASCVSHVVLDLAGAPSVTLSTSQVDAGSTDNCAITEKTLSQSVFTTADIGEHVIAFTVKDASGNFDVCYTKVYVINTVYCSSKGLNTGYEYVDRVVFNTIDNPSGDDGGYGDYTAELTYLNRGHTYSIYLFPGYSGASYREYWRVWIDWNQNRVFEPSELVLSKDDYGTIAESVTVPPDAKYGLTLMRVSMKWGGYPSPCETFGYGEVEDYSVKVIPAGGLREDVSAARKEKPSNDFVVQPNPARDYIRIMNREEGDRFIITDRSGSEIQEVAPGMDQLDISALQPDVYLMICIHTDGRRTVRKFIKL